MLKLAIDHEFESRTWWQSGGQALWDAISDGAGSVVLEDAIARSWLEQAGRLPGWNEGHEYAPHPIAAAAFGDDEPEL
ncbi:MAG TPA: hypothetical protein VNE71_03665 [Myxococcota bacterium]|jgi:hypothetical protein|nr:hypothetical protein [Myxococcota bacterium]